MRAALVGLFVLGSATLAHAAPGPTGGQIVVRGDVVGATSRWTADGSRIVTDAIVRDASGVETAVSQLGGHVGNLTMRVIPGDALLAPGMTVEVWARPGATATGRSVLAVEDVTVVRDTRIPFVRTGPTPGGTYLYWAASCALVTIADEGTRAIGGDAEFAVIDAVLATWNTGTESCSYMHAMSNGRRAGQEVGTDRLNLIKFRDVTWCRPAVDDDPPRCYSPNTAGITTVTYVDEPDGARDGEIIDADIELNGVDFAISINGITLGTQSCLAELSNTLTHEIGHLLGLEHSCRAPTDPPRVDGDGNDVPLCTQTSDPEITEATMYNFQDCGEVKKATLEADDIDAICAVYPESDDPGTCEPPDTGTSTCAGCAAGGSPAGPVLLGVGILALITRRRRAV